jgi:hypothetical protein
MVRSNFNTVDSKTIKGHKNKPLGDWDIVVLEDTKKFQIEKEAARYKKKQ